MSLATYRKKRRFDRTTEPPGKRTARSTKIRIFVVQKHDASRLHYDFRLELDGVLKSWAVPKGPRLDPAVKALAVHVEDHPLEYASFEGSIPEGQYGAGAVMVWDYGTWQAEGDPRRDYERGNLTFQLEGRKLKGRWKLIRMGGKAGDQGKNWLLMKLDDSESRANGRALDDRSVATGRTLEQIEAGERPRPRSDRSNGKPQPKPTRKSARKNAAKSRKNAAKSPVRPKNPKSSDPEPRLLLDLANVEGGSWTSDGILRHAVFHGLREDKKPSSVARERPVAAPSSAARKPRRAAKPQTQSRIAPDVRLTNPDRVLYPGLGLTKRDLADYYTRIADWILPHLAERPLAIVRCPEGREGACFFQRHVGQGMPQGIYGIKVEEKEGPVQNLAIKDLSGLLGLVQIGALEIHPWGSREKRLDRPDRLIFDLDPGDGVTWPDLIAAARELKQRLEALDLTSFVRTTGGKGIHLVLPIRPTLDWAALKSFARGFASTLERDHPDRYVSKMSKARRAGKIYVDYLRNEQGSTAIASYSTRARPGAPVATPITWSELGPRLGPGAFTVATIPRRLARRTRDPWEGFISLNQSLRRHVIDQFTVSPP